jgi:hypothetical protein
MFRLGAMAHGMRQEEGGRDHSGGRGVAKLPTNDKTPPADAGGVTRDYFTTVNSMRRLWNRPASVALSAMG